MMPAKHKTGWLLSYGDLLVVQGYQLSAYHDKIPGDNSVFKTHNTFRLLYVDYRVTRLHLASPSNICCLGGGQSGGSGVGPQAEIRTFLGSIWGRLIGQLNLSPWTTAGFMNNLTCPLCLAALLLSLDFVTGNGFYNITPISWFLSSIKTCYWRY